jgi:hypothetical protein
MRRHLLTPLLLLSLCAAMSADLAAQQTRIDTRFKDGVTTVSLEPLLISGEVGKYYSLHLVTSFKYPGERPAVPEYVDLQIQTIVKARRLNLDLYIVFIADGETIFLSSNRWAVKNPVPGKRMIGERIQMRVPLGTFMKIARAKEAAIKLDDVRMVIGEKQKAALLELTAKM